MEGRLDELPLINNQMSTNGNILSIAKAIQEEFKKDIANKHINNKEVKEGEVAAGQTKEMNKLHRIQVFFHSVNGFFAIAVIIFAIFRIELSWNPDLHEYEDNDTTVKFGIVMLVICVISVLIVLVTIYLDFRIYRLKIYFPLSLVHFLGTKNALITSIIEIFLAFVHPFFFLRPDIFWLLFISLFKTYSIIYVLMDSALIYKEKDTIRQMFRLFSLPLPSINANLVIREFAYSYAWIFFFVSVVVIIIFASYLFFISERPFRSFDSDTELSYFNTIYWATVTSATVGFGDITPNQNNTFSIFITSIVAILGAFIISTTIGLLVNQIELTDNEKSVLEISQRLKSLDEQKKAAATVILSLLELRQIERTISENMNPSEDLTVRNIHQKFVDSIYRFSKISWEIEHVNKFNFSNNLIDSSLYLKRTADYHEESSKFLERTVDEMENMSNFFIESLNQSIEMMSGSFPQ
ncbi:hypothetical protein TRFO_07817 [Tritrichomonas foetus]|uniref:Potassium channel domain-containing protein n=1 Tax=Tritrichomonas foetus TaxID=1144522 RepID=A0A1J4JTJ6_9EUKA|nr:hypothetical protein TRFO_07817 [Tritrichomonas foetus]|eukprot:OHT00820.1 hypothetical protein TRFO_07817 [Tritrichomonas foetus]